MGLEFWASWATIVGGIAVLLAGMNWLIKRVVRSAVAEIKHDTQELKANGGGHVADKVQVAADVSERTLEAVVEVRAELTKLNDRVTGHLIQSEGRWADHEARLQYLARR